MQRGARERRTLGDARVVHEHVYRPDALEEGGHRLLVGDIEHVASASLDPILPEPLGNGFPDPLRTAGDDDRPHRSAFRSSLPDGVFGRSSTIRTSRGTLCGDRRARTKSCSVLSSTGSRTTTKARASVSPLSCAPTTAASTTCGWPTRQCSISAGATQIPPTLIRSSTRPRYQK